MVGPLGSKGWASWWGGWSSQGRAGLSYIIQADTWSSTLVHSGLGLMEMSFNDCILMTFPSKSRK